MRYEIKAFCGNDVWYLVHCQAKKEKYAADSLESIFGINVFYPEIQVRSHGILKHAPFFPGYIFIYADLQKIPMRCINTCPGVLRLVGFDDFPQSVSQYVIDIISQNLTRLPRFSTQPTHSFNPGDIVQIKDGPLQELEMIFVGPTTSEHRVRVLLNLLGRQKEIQVNANTLEKSPIISEVSQKLAPRKERHTRGKGRKIRQFA